MTSDGWKAPGRLIAGAVALLSLAGCSSFGSGQSSQTAAQQAAPVRAADPLAQFAADAAPGASGAVTLASGRTVTAYLARSYDAASGRECREVRLGSTPQAESQIFCFTGTQWVAARPLLRGGAVARP